MAGIVAGKMGFYIGYILLFTAAFFYGLKFVHSEVQLDFKINDIEDSVVINRMIRCFSEDNEFGVFDNAKVSDGRLKKCFGRKYNFAVKLDRQIGESKRLSMGNLQEPRHVVRYVIVDNSATRLEVDYSKNAA